MSFEPGPSAIRGTSRIQFVLTSCGPEPEQCTCGAILLWFRNRYGYRRPKCPTCEYGPKRCECSKQLTAGDGGARSSAHGHAIASTTVSDFSSSTVQGDARVKPPAVAIERKTFELAGAFLAGRLNDPALTIDEFRRRAQK